MQYLPRSLKTVRLALATGIAAGALSVASPIIAPQAVPYAHAAINAPAAGFADLVEKVSPAVVSIIVKSQRAQVAQVPGLEGIPAPFRRFFEAPGGNVPFNGGNSRQRPTMSQGSGFFISDDGYVVTNHHVIDNAREVTVRLADGREFDATIVGQDSKTDLALLRVEADIKFEHVELAQKGARVGDWVVAVGNPFGLGGTVTAGIVSARGRDIGAGPYDDFLQIDASVNKGNSGGPAFSLDGKVIGVNTAIFSPSGGNVGIAFAIPASTVKTVIDQLRDNGKVARGWLGVSVQPVNAEIAESLDLDEARGALVASIVDDSPAEGKLRVGDVITKVGEEHIDDGRELARVIGSAAPNSSVDLSIWRAGRDQKISLTLAAQSAEPKRVAVNKTVDESASLAKLGIAATRDSEGQVRIADVASGSPAQDAGLQRGMIILQANGRDTSSVDQVEALVDEARKKGRKSVLLLVATQDRGNRFVALPIDQA